MSDNEERERLEKAVKEAEKDESRARRKRMIAVRALESFNYEARKRLELIDNPPERSKVICY